MTDRPRRPMRQDNMQRQLERLRRELASLVAQAPDPTSNGAHEASTLAVVTLRAIAALWSAPAGR